MTKENSEWLFSKYRKLFPETYFNDVPMTSFSFDIGDGWFNLLNELLAAMEKSRTPEDDWGIIQVKEKWGSLRVYTTHGTDELYDLLDKAEETSSSICEECGAPGKITGKQWLAALCDECLKKRENEYDMIGV